MTVIYDTPVRGTTVYINSHLMWCTICAQEVISAHPVYSVEEGYTCGCTFDCRHIVCSFKIFIIFAIICGGVILDCGGAVGT